MHAFDQGAVSWSQNILINIGAFLSNYLIAIVFLFPESIRNSFFGGIISYVSAFIMTVPITVLGSLLIKNLGHNRQ